MDDWKREGAYSSGSTAEVLGFSRPAFTLLRDLIAERTGVFYDGGKLDLLADKLTEVVAARGLSSYLDYYYLLRYDADAARHWAELMDRLAVPETFFWRQSEQITAVASSIAPAHFAARPYDTLRIWSAACCTGEEPLSIAMALSENGWFDRGRVEIVASDASQALLSRAQRGLFGERSFRALPEPLRDKYFTIEGRYWRVDQRLLDRVRWTTANLMEPAEVQPLAASNVIFCRNVFIYFSDQGIERVVRQFAEHMREPAHLFVGASESLTRLSTGFDLAEVDGAFVYVRRAGQRSAHSMGI